MREDPIASTSSSTDRDPYAGMRVETVSYCVEVEETTPSYTGRYGYGWLDSCPEEEGRSKSEMSFGDDGIWVSGP